MFHKVSVTVEKAHLQGPTKCWFLAYGIYSMSSLPDLIGQADEIGESLNYPIAKFHAVKGFKGP